MKTHILTNKISKSHTQTALKLAREKCGVMMALVLLSTTQLAVSADIILAPVPQHQHMPSGPDSFAGAPTPPSIPSTEAYTSCVSKAMDFLDSGVCNGTSNILNCIKAQFIATGDNCALYL
ncbi:MAG: hypothetical protein V3V31_08990 [Methylococcales bacterium]